MTVSPHKLRSRPDRITRVGRVVSIKFPNLVEARHATTYFENLVQLADEHMTEFRDVTEALNEHTHELVRTRTDEEPFRRRMEKQRRPSGVS